MKKTSRLYAHGANSQNQQHHRTRTILNKYTPHNNNHKRHKHLQQKTTSNEQTSLQESIQGPIEPTTPPHSDGWASPKKPTTTPCITTPELPTHALEPGDQNLQPPTHTTPDDMDSDPVIDPQTTMPNSDNIQHISTTQQTPQRTPTQTESEKVNDTQHTPPEPPNTQD